MDLVELTRFLAEGSRTAWEEHDEQVQVLLKEPAFDKSKKSALAQ